MKVNSFSATALFGVMVLFGVFHLGICREDPYIRMRLGGNDDEIESLARFAVQEHNRKENGLLEFTRVLKAREQVVAGKLYHLTLEAIDAGMKKVYEAKVWVKPWMKFKQLQEFKHAHYDPSFTTSDLGVKPDGHVPRWESVSIHDPEVLDAANHAITSIQQRSNSLSPYKLLEILLARAKVIEDSAVFDLLLKVTRGVKVEKFKVNLNKSINGKFYLNQIEQDPS